MTASESSPLKIASNAMNDAEESLTGLPSIAEVRDLQRRWLALRSVIHGIVFTGVPTITHAQRTKLAETAVSLAKEVAETRRRLRP